MNGPMPAIIDTRIFSRPCLYSEISNRPIQELESTLTHRKQTAATSSNRPNFRHVNFSGMKPLAVRQNLISDFDLRQRN